MTSSESIPDPIDLDEEEPPCQQPTSTRSGNAIHPATLALNKKATAVLIDNLLPSPLSSDKEKPEGRRTPEATREGLVTKEEVPEQKHHIHRQ